MGIEEGHDPDDSQYSSFDHLSTSLPFDPQSMAASLLSAQSVSSVFSDHNTGAPVFGGSTITSTSTTPPMSPSSTPTSTPSITPASEARAAASSTSYDPSTAPFSSPTSTTTHPHPTFVGGTGNQNANDGDNNGGWGGMGHGTHVGVVMAGIICVALVVGLSFWFCCGGRARWARRHARAEPNSSLPLYAVPNQATNGAAGVHRPNGGAGDAPPVYEEVAPPQHQSIARGLRADEVVNDAAVVSDGKMPVSEMVFEDVVLERQPSESSSSRDFDSRHHAMGGNTTGHTNV